MPYRAYRYYALFVLVLVGAFNAADRSILSVLAQAIKTDLAISDTRLAFLYGTAFVTFYTLLGLPAARLADRMRRPTLLAAGLGLWSCFTALGGLASSFAMLAIARFGVGIGEATANPVSHSLVCDYFPARHRARMLAVYLAGLFVGGGAAATIGGHFLGAWPGLCTGLDLCAVRPWQAAFLAVGLPGVLLAMLVYTLREPVRGAIDGEPVVPARTGHWAAAGRDLLAVLPVVATVALWRSGGRQVARRNATYGLCLFAAALSIAALTGDVAQWMALFIGVNAIVSWAQHTAIVDPAFIRLTVGTKAFRYGVIGYAFMGGMMGAVQFWMIPYAIRTLDVTAAQAGLILGPVIALSSLVGMIAGGIAADAWNASDRRGYLRWSLVVLGFMAMGLAAMMATTTIATYAVAAFAFNTASVAWSGASAAQAQSLVLPRMRATTSALNALCITLVTMAVGPYAAGKIGEASGSLLGGLSAMLVLAVPAALFLVLAARHSGQAVATRVARAQAA